MFCQRSAVIAWKNLYYYNHYVFRHAHIFRGSNFHWQLSETAVSEQSFSFKTALSFNYFSWLLKNLVKWKHQNQRVSTTNDYNLVNKQTKKNWNIDLVGILRRAWYDDYLWHLLDITPPQGNSLVRQNGCWNGSLKKKKKKGIQLQWKAGLPMSLTISI